MQLGWVTPGVTLLNVFALGSSHHQALVSVFDEFLGFNLNTYPSLQDISSVLTQSIHSIDEELPNLALIQKWNYCCDPHPPDSRLQTLDHDGTWWPALDISNIEDTHPLLSLPSCAVSVCNTIFGNNILQDTGTSIMACCKINICTTKHFILWQMLWHRPWPSVCWLVCNADMPSVNITITIIISLMQRLPCNSTHCAVVHIIFQFSIAESTQATGCHRTDWAAVSCDALSLSLTAWISWIHYKPRHAYFTPTPAPSWEHTLDRYLHDTYLRIYIAAGSRLIYPCLKLVGNVVFCKN